MFDPVEVIYKILGNYNWESEGVQVVRQWEAKAIDLRKSDYIIIGGVRERDEFLGIGAREYMRRVSVRLQIRVAESRERAREIVNKVRQIFRNKDNWFLDGVWHLNMQIVDISDRTDAERRVFTHLLEISWFVVEVV